LSSPIDIGVLLAVGIAAGFINVMAGGGSAITLPTLIFLGLNSALANGTNRIAILIQNISAVISFKKEIRQLPDQNFNLSLKLSLLTLPGAILGVIIAVNISDSLFKTILSIVMIGIIISMLLPGKKFSYNKENENLNWKIILSMLFVGFYGGFIQVGVGFIIMAVLNNLMKLNLVHVNMHKVFIVLIYTIPAISIFLFTSNINWFYGISLAAGNAIGGWWAVKFQVKKGEKAVKILLTFAILIMALKLINII
jgi:uncharacterized membrane protein YfcA